MSLSARNHLPGTIEELVCDSIVCHVIVRVGEHHIESVITRRSADDLNCRRAIR
jgi:molybdopterin-binding protein